jgi:uncharacterized Zn finger protein
MEQTLTSRFPNLRFCVCGVEAIFPDDIISRDGKVLTYQCRTCGTTESILAYYKPIRGQVVNRGLKESVFKDDFDVIDDKISKRR